MDKQYIEKKLADLRARWKTANPSMKLFIEQGAKLLKEKLAKINLNNTPA